MLYMPGIKIDQLEALSAVNVMVVGDMILDHYVRGYTERTSPEAPVPVVVFESEQSIPGGAANVARNIAAAGARVSCLGVIGDDSEGELLKASLLEANVAVDGIISSQGERTTTKTRVVSQGQQVVRLDREGSHKLSGNAESQILRLIGSQSAAGAILLSDYAKGVLTDSIIRAAFAAGAKAGVPVIVDPKGRDYARYRGAYALTPNAREAHEATGVSTADPEGLTQASRVIFEMTDCQLLAITRGAHGVAVFQRGQAPLFLPTTAREVFDVTGAGDTFVGWLAMGCAGGLAAEICASIANAAAGVVVSKSGAAVATLPEVRGALMPGRVGRKLRQVSDLEKLGNDLRSEGKRIVFTNGCFDFLHAGHVAFLQDARALGDVLVLATNTDTMIHRLKGEGRPVIAEEQRLSMLASIEAVDYLVPFPDETPHALLAALRPHLLVKGSNYSMDQVEGHEIVESYSGEVRLLEVLPSIVTHELLAQRKN
ncbi:MAG: PfkB family carbohydrate kinase [Candidatus Sumerlaeaceae bacterium]